MVWNVLQPWHKLLEAHRIEVLLFHDGDYTIESGQLSDLLQRTRHDSCRCQDETREVGVVEGWTPYRSYHGGVRTKPTPVMRYMRLEFAVLIRYLTDRRTLD